jgi:hypothetical protein
VVPAVTSQRLVVRPALITQSAYSFVRNLLERFRKGMLFPEPKFITIRYSR